MGRRALPWLLAVPLLAAGSLAAHSLTYRLAHPGEPEREAVLAAAGHGYLDQVPFVLGALTAFLLAGLLVAGRIGARRTGDPALPSWPLALLPPVTFAVQEHAERALASGELPLDAITEPTFLLGLTLQVPFGLAALALGRWLGRAAAAAGAVLAATPCATPSLRPPTAVPAPRPAPPVRRTPLVSGFALRAPPA